MLACMDAGNMSSPLAIPFIIATAKALGHNIEDLVINCTSLRKQRKEYRRRHDTEISENFKIPDTFVLHWDGKLLPAMTGNEKVERLAIVLTAANIEELISIPIIECGTEKMNMINSVEMVCFDTTATNTGKRNGAGMLLEQKLKRSLLWLPCRHHIAEIILRAVFEIYFGKSCGPEVAIFESFWREWNTFNLKDFSIGIMDEEVRRAINAEECEANKEFCIKNIAKDHIRHD
ncbi:uncharacterized protein LOC126766704 isoform X2 [Bactrocera neohumeralis]|uniref:uncharacterized protein LOC126766704 isoform X2 n=1 Tax=Bactrocera neohumeralis TaxID=98809 RepID=UPI0021660DC7|nr:uncharacterized protein LOC126766704 isoform X2 [Bactrocera neohumeralis]